MNILHQAGYIWALRKELIVFVLAINRKLFVSLAVCEWKLRYMQVKRKCFCDVAGGFEVRCSVTLTMQCWQCGAVPRFMYSADREPKSTCLVVILVIYFLGFFVFKSNQHSEGVGCEDDNEGWGGMRVTRNWRKTQWAVICKEEFHAWSTIRDSLFRKERPSENWTVPWYSNSDVILLMTETRWAWILGCSSSRRRGSCNCARL